MRSIFLLLMLFGSLTASAFVPNTNVIDEVSVFDGVSADVEYEAPAVLFVEPGFAPETVPLGFLEDYVLIRSVSLEESTTNLDMTHRTSWRNSEKPEIKNPTKSVSILHYDPGA